MAERYTISIPSAVIERLHKKLDLTDFPDQLDAEDQWPYGAPLTDIKRLVYHWRTGFNINEAFDKLNELPHFMTTISVDGFGETGVHFLHRPSPVKGAIPLLFCHGWPGSFLEASKMFDMLKGTDKAPGFHFVAPSLPNFGFSDGIKKPGFALAQYAETCHKLMLSLGYDEYVTQGGDWGAFITRSMGLLYPAHCKASHLNLIVPRFPGITTPLLALQAAVSLWTERESLKKAQRFESEGGGYMRVQSTRPQTLGYSLSDSPVGLLAWIYEKLHAWSLDYPWTDDEVLTWVSIYYFSTAGPAASVRIYYEVMHPDAKGLGVAQVCGWIPHVKFGLGYFPGEVVVLPKAWAASMGEIVYSKDHEAGGHFAAWDNPNGVVNDLQAMFAKDGPCYGLIKGKNGYDA